MQIPMNRDKAPLPKLLPARALDWGACVKYHDRAHLDSVAGTVAVDAFEMLANEKIPLQDRLWFCFHSEIIPLDVLETLHHRLLRPVDAAIANGAPLTRRAADVLNRLGKSIAAGSYAGVPVSLAIVYCEMQISKTTRAALDEISAVINAELVAVYKGG